MEETNAMETHGCWCLSHSPPPVGHAWSTIRRQSIPPVVRFQGTSASVAGPCDAFQCVTHSGGRKNKTLPPFVSWVRSGPGIAIDKLRPNSVKGNCSPSDLWSSIWDPINGPIFWVHAILNANRFVCQSYNVDRGQRAEFVAAQVLGCNPFFVV